MPALPAFDSSETAKISATAVMSGTINNSSSSPGTSTNEESSASMPEASTTTPKAVGPPAAQAWNTSILCKHLANITGNKPLPAAENVVEEPIVAKCFPGFVCVNGICTGGMSCKCYDGWAGLFCQAPCPTDCAPQGSCMTSTNNQAICVCNETSRYTPGVGCVEKPPEFFTTTTPAPLTTPKGLRPLSERECFGAFTCLYGYCQFSSLECTCDPGWKGQLCDQPCQLNCSGHGRCRESDEFILQCVCDPNYAGESCEIVLQRSLAGPAQNSSQPKNDQVDMSAWYQQNNSTSAKDKTKPNLKEASTTGKNETEEDNGTETALKRPLSERECQAGFVCQHGYCEKGQKMCVCDEGWGGARCNLTCELKCGSKGTCVASDDEEPYCQCQGGYVGKLCQHSEQDKRPVGIGVDTLLQDPWKELAAEHGLLPPLSQRLCSRGFVCAYGSCSRPDPGGVACICDARFAGKHCQVPCPLVCAANQHCQFNSANQTPGCHCNHGYSGPNCTEEASGATSEPLSTLTIGLLSSGLLLLLLLLLCVVLPVVLYRNGNITMMRIVHSFRGYEEDDRKEYDAFILFVSADLDRQFVIQTLVPKLEGRMCLTLCIQQRNLVPSIPTATNTVELARQSRRVILIVSPSFITGSCGSDEYQAIHEEMLREKHKILLIVLGDIDAGQSKTDASIYRILNSATSLKYPGKNGNQQDYNDFWSRLELSMPKKRLNSLESGKGQSCLMSPSISSSSECTQDPKAPLEIRLFTNGNLNTQLLQRIVRVPAYKLDTSEKSPPVVCAAFERILGKADSDDSDVQEENVENFATRKDSYYRLRHSDPAVQNSIPNGIVNGGFDYTDIRQTKGIPS
ncbi:hypothetical protein BsWGS_02346 [Bradybaena similaris]